MKKYFKTRMTHLRRKLRLVGHQSQAIEMKDYTVPLNGLVFCNNDVERGVEGVHNGMKVLNEVNNFYKVQQKVGAVN